MRGYTRDEYFMHRAMLLAKESAARGEIPVGAVIVRDGRIIAEAGNGRERDKSALAHAELTAIGKACKVLGGWRLTGCELYVTLEPCTMCAGAIINARIPRVIFGTFDPKAGAMGGLFDVDAYPLNHHPEVVSGVLGEECAELLRSFFRERRSGKGFDPAKNWREKNKKSFSE